MKVSDLPNESRYYEDKEIKLDAVLVKDVEKMIHENSKLFMSKLGLVRQKTIGSGDSGNFGNRVVELRMLELFYKMVDKCDALHEIKDDNNVLDEVKV